MIKVIKRDCSEADFDKSKISTAILKAMKNGSGIVKPKIAEDIADEIEEECKDKDEVSISDIESMVYDKLITKKQRLTAKAYEGYRSIREFQRENENTTDIEIHDLVEDKDEYWKDENANKNPVLNPTKRDYIAGSVSTDMTKRYLLSPEIIQAHNEGLIHFHDADYFLQHMHNCGLVNSEDMLQNNTVISETLIETPHSFSTACNIETQAIAQIASNQYGGQSISVDRFTDKVGNIANAKNFDPNKHKYYGRFNQGVVTISLPDIAFSSDGDFDKFWEIFEERTELCHKALRARHERLLGTSSDVAPILWQHGAYARLKKHEKIDRLLYDGYSTISLGYAGLYECVKFMTGHSHSDEGIGEEFGLKVMQALNDKCNQWKQAENIDYSLYGTPLESTTYKFAKCLKSRFGSDIFKKLDGFDRNYITNSYHIPVFEHITAFEKLRIESKFQKLSPGGAISYIEVPNMSHNIPAILEVIKFIYNNIMYAEINTKSCYCEKCGFDGDIPLVSDENNRLKWECPNCGNTDNTTMDIAFRVCGYIGTAKNGGNQGRYGDIHDRVYHLDDMEYTED